MHEVLRNATVIPQPFNQFPQNYSTISNTVDCIYTVKIQNLCIATKIPNVAFLVISISLPPTPMCEPLAPTNLYFYNVISRVIHKWNHTVPNHFGLAFSLTTLPWRYNKSPFLFITEHSMLRKQHSLFIHSSIEECLSVVSSSTLL